jgi:NADPH-dependent curcumin reductase CurA
MSSNREVVLAGRPKGLPKDSDFRVQTAGEPSPRDGEVVLETAYLSVDPYMRGRMNEGASYFEPFEVDQPISGLGVGRVRSSRAAGFDAGDVVEGMLPWRDRSAVPAAGLRRIDAKLAPITTALGVLGMPGLSAYFGLLDVTHPKAGETAVISGAAGAVGSIAGQIARIKGCRTIGIAGGDDKVRHLTDDLKFDAAYNYRTTTDHREKLKELCPAGIDVYFDNVGGAVTDAVLTLINSHARISLCGQISQYNQEKPEMGPRLLFMLVVKQARMEGWLVMQYKDRWGEALRELAGWVKSGKIVYREHLTEGLENAPRAFIGMLTGENTGKALVKVAAT